MDAGQALLLLETAATLVVAGVLGTMQVLNHPSHGPTGRDASSAYEKAHHCPFGLMVSARLGAVTRRPQSGGEYG